MSSLNGHLLSNGDYLRSHPSGLGYILGHGIEFLICAAKHIHLEFELNLISNTILVPTNHSTTSYFEDM